MILLAKLRLASKNSGTGMCLPATRGVCQYGVRTATIGNLIAHTTIRTLDDAL